MPSSCASRGAQPAHCLVQGCLRDNQRTTSSAPCRSQLGCPAPCGVLAGPPESLTARSEAAGRAAAPCQPCARRQGPASSTGWLQGAKLLRLPLGAVPVRRAAIDAISADNLKLKEELMLENKFSVNPTTQTAAALIAHLEAQADVYAEKVQEAGLGVALVAGAGRVGCQLGLL